MSRISIIAALVLSLFIVTTAQAQEHDHEFVYQPEENPSRVSVAGDFNNWSSDATPMKKAADGSWRATVRLPEGVQYYKFVVNGDQWKPDPKADKSLDVGDNHGGVNSGVLIGPDARKVPPAKSNQINVAALMHDPQDMRDVDVVGDGRLRLRLRAQADDVEKVDVVCNGKGFALYRAGKLLGFDQFVGMAGTIGTEAPTSYYFVLRDGSDEAILNAKGGFAGAEAKVAEKVGPNFSVLPAHVSTPDWAKHAVWYQIFPERFRNGDPSNDPGDKEYEHLVPWTSNWWKPAPGEAPGDENFYKGQGNVWKRRYGGDVQGLTQSLPYLRKLGVNAIYLNPVFEADSMHKYDASDYRHIDDNFGVKGDIAQLQGETDDPATWQWTKSDKLFLDFVSEAHKQGFKVIIDGVFNHVGKSHPFFQDVLKNGKSSKYADWFEVMDFESNPIKYKSWDGDGHLPVFKKDAARGLAPGPYAHIMAITKRWLAPDGDPSKGVDGWRLDVPGDIPHPFWVDWRKTVKEAHPDAYITGEIWTWAQPWLKGDQFDAVMNYRWADAAQQFFVNQKTAISPGKFDELLNQIAYAYPFQVSLVNQNLFDSHDTDRFASMFVNPDLPYDGKNRIQDNGPDYKPDKPTAEQQRRMQQAVAAQMAFVGAPMIYYGDEAGMWSPDDPSNRMPMVWEEMKFDDPQVNFDPEMFAFYQRAIAVRQKLPALQTGFFRGVLYEDDRGVYVFARDLGDQHAYVVLNRSNQQRKIDVPVGAPNGTKMVNWIDPAQTTMTQAENDRPVIELKPDARGAAVVDGVFSITLKPFATAIVTKQ